MTAKKTYMGRCQTGGCHELVPKGFFYCPECKRKRKLAFQKERRTGVKEVDRLSRPGLQTSPEGAKPAPQKSKAPPPMSEDERRKLDDAKRRQDILAAQEMERRRDALSPESQERIRAIMMRGAL